MQSWDDAARVLAQRLRALREHEWPDAAITQRQLAQALSNQKPVSVPLVSSWENVNRPTVPPEERLVAYATFFATRRSVERSPRLLQVEELTDAERARRDELLRELRVARAAALRQEPARPVPEPLGGPWRFDDERPITMVCAELPLPQRQHLPGPDDPERAYADLYAVADLDALFELHGHIRAANPTSLVGIRTSSALTRDDYSTHLVVLGGVDWNRATRGLLDRLDLPVTQTSSDVDGSHFTVEDEGGPQHLYAERATDGSLRADVGHFFRAPNPYNAQRTVTMCNGSTSRGVFGAVRALTDELFRDRNAAYLQEGFPRADAVSILMRVAVVDDQVLTPDWTRPDMRLHEWARTAS